MIIANPIYDRVFTHLTEDLDTAKFIIGTLLDQPIMSIDAKSQELSYYTPEEKGIKPPLLRLMRLDFVATVRTKTGEYKRSAHCGTQCSEKSQKHVTSLG
jgi:hypothetical protein